MGLFDLPAPVLGAIDQFMSLALPGVIRLVLWGVLAGWMTMVIYRRLSNQERIQQLKAEQKKQQKIISTFDGEFEQLFPVIGHTLALGMRQLGLSLGPALLATLPVLFVIIWVAGAFGYQQPAMDSPVNIETPAGQELSERLHWDPTADVERITTGWILRWPSAEHPVSLLQDGEVLFKLPFADGIPVIHKRQWWNWLMANPVGYLPDNAAVDTIDIGLPPQQFVSFGPQWLRGWMFTFFASFLLSSIGFKLAMKID